MRKFIFLILIFIALMFSSSNAAPNLKISRVERSYTNNENDPKQYIRIYITNTGITDATGVQVKISAMDNEVTSYAYNYGTVNVGQETNSAGSSYYYIYFSENTSSGYTAIVTVTMTDSSNNTWTDYFAITMGQSTITYPVLLQLLWTEESADYTSDGVYPKRGNAGTIFIFRVKYKYTKAPADGYPKVHIKKGNNEISESPFTMSYVSGSYLGSGAIYSYSTNLTKTGADYTYYFEAKDSNNNTATSAADAPDVNVIFANEDTTIITEDGTQIDVPKNTLNTGVTINVNTPSTIPNGEVQKSTYSSVKAIDVLKEITVSDGTKNFRNDIKITIPFKELDVVGIDKSKLKFFYWSEGINMWVLIPNSQVNTSKNTVSCYVNHLTIFRIMAIEVSSAKMVLYNNLFNPTKSEKVYVRYDLTKDQNVNIVVYNIIGQKIKELVNERKGAGSYTDLTWDGKNDNGEVVASGTYIIYLVADEFKEKKKCVIVK